MEEEESMDFHGMNRKQLQALCKKHGVLANLSNREMADRLSLILEKNKKLVSQGDSLVKNLSKKVSESNSKVVKKVRFSPENETFIYEISGYQRGGRRRFTKKPLSKKQTQVIENEVTGRKRGRRDVKDDTKSDVESDATGGLVKRRLRNREVVVVEKSGGDLMASEKHVSRRGSKKVENEAIEDNAATGKDAKPSGRNTRSRAKFEGKSSESGAVEEECGNVPQFDEIRNGKGRNDMQKYGDGAKQGKVLRRTKVSVAEHGDSEMLIENSRKVEVSGRRTRSQAKIAGKLSAAGRIYEDETVPLEEPSKDLAGCASMRESVAPNRGRAGSKTLAEDGAEQDKVLQKAELNVTKDGDSEMSIEDSRVVEVSKRSTRSQVKIAGKASAAENEIEEEIVQHEEPSKDLGKYVSTRKSVGLQRGKVETNGLQEKKGTKKKSRKKNSNLEAASKFEAVLKPSKEMEKVENVYVPSDPLRRTRRSRVMFTASVSTVGELETHETVEETKKRTRNSNPKLEAASRFEAIEESSKTTEKVENVSVPSGPSRRTRRNTIMFTSSVSTGGELETRHTVQGTRKRTRNNNTNLEAASKFEAIVEPSKEIEEVENVSAPSGPSRRTRRNAIMFTSSVSTDGDSESHQTVRVEDACLSKVHQRRSSRNASRNNSTLINSQLEGIANGVGKGKQQKHRREPIIDEEISTSKCKPLLENPPRQSSRVVSKGDLAEPAGQTFTVVGKKRHSRSRMAVIVASPSESFSAPKEPPIEDARLAVGEAARTNNNLDASYSKQVLESSNKKKKTSKGEFEAVKQRGSVEVSTVNSAIKEATNATVNLEETSPANQSNGKGDSGDVSLVELEVTGMNNKASIVISPEITSPAVGFSPANQSYNWTEPSNILAREKAIEAEEQPTEKNINHGSDNADDHSNKDDRTLVQEHQTLVQSDGKETAETAIQEALLVEKWNELSERSSEKRFELSLENTEERSVTYHSDEKGSSHTENYLEAVEMQEIVAESNLVISESSALGTAEMQLSTDGGNATEATPSTPALETEAMAGFYNEVNNGPDHTFIANNVDMKNGAYNADVQNVFQSTGLEGGNTYSIREEEFSGNETEISDKIICIGEYSVSNAWDGICGQAKTRDDVTTNKNQPQETFYNERTSQVLGEKITEEDYDGNLLVGGNAIPGSVKRIDGAAEKKENEVSELYTLDAVESENEVSEQNPNNFSKENSGRCMHEPLDAEEIDLIITEERGSDVVKDISVANIDLQSPCTGDKENCPKLALLENESINDEHETVSDISTIRLSSSRARLSVQNDMKDKLKAKLNEDAKDVLMAEVQTESFPQFALEKLQYSMEGDTTDASNISGKVLCQPFGDCNLGNRTEVQDSDLVGEKSCNIGVDVPLNECCVATKEIDEKIFNGESGVEQCSDVLKEENTECALKVELDKNVHNLEIKGFNGESDVEESADAVIVEEENANCVLEVEFGDKNDLEGVAAQVNDVGGASLREIIVKESKFSDDRSVEIMIAPSECIERVDMLKIKESNLKNRNSDAVVMNVGPLSQVIVNHIVKKEGADVDDCSIQNSEIAADREACSETIKNVLVEVDNGGTSVQVSPINPGKAFRDDFTEINDTAPAALNEIVSATCEDLEEKSMEVLGLVQHVDEVKFDNLKDYKEENVLELERICFVTSDSLMSSNDTDGHRKENSEKMAGDLSFNFNSSDDVKKGNIYAIPQVSANDINDHLLETGFHNASDSDHNVLLDDVGEVSVDGDADAENVEDGTKWGQKTPNCSQTIENRRNWSMKNSAKGKCIADSSFDRPEMGSNTAAVSHSMVLPSVGLTENKSLDLHVDFPQLTSLDMNLILSVGEQVEVEKSAGDILEANWITQDCEDALDVKENLTNDEHVTEKQLGEQEHQIHLTVSDEPLEMTRDIEDVLEVKESETTNEQVNKQVIEMQLGEQKNQSHLTVSDEPLEMTRDCEDSLEVEESVTNNEHVTEKQQGEQENQSHLTASDGPNCDVEETNEQNGLSAINQECKNDDIDKDSSHVSAEKVMLKDATPISGCNVDDSDMFNVEYGSHDSKKAGTVAVNPAVSNFSESKGVAAEVEGAKKMDMPEDVENGGTCLPIMPVEQCANQENPEEASPEIAGTILQQIFSSSSAWEEKNISEDRFFSDAFSTYEFTASSTVSGLYDLAFCNEIQIKDFSNNAGGEMAVDEDRGESYRDVARHFQEDDDSTFGKSNATESFSLENHSRDTQEVIKEQLGDGEGNRNDATCPGNIYCSALNQSPCDNRSKSHVVEADGLRCIDDVVVTAGDSNEIADFENLNGASSLVPEMDVDCSAVSLVSDFPNSELKVEPDNFIAREINMFSGPGKQDEIENSDAGETCLISQDAGDVKENALTVEQVALQVTEQVQLREHETTQEVSKFTCRLNKISKESRFEGGEGSKEQECVLDRKHGTPDHKNPKIESLNLESIDSARSGDAAAEDAWRLELNLLSPPKKSPDVKSVRDKWFAKKMNSSMKVNSSVRKQSFDRSSLIRRTPKQVVHDMKENVLSTKREFSSITAHKTASKRRALEDLRKN
ncbi:hypothetical protein ACOSQ2_009822 [Xanthoceras sorbifolium]